MTRVPQPATISAMRKLDQWYTTLTPEEQAEFAGLIALARTGAAQMTAGRGIGSADDEGESIQGFSMPGLLSALSAEHAPHLVEALAPRSRVL